MRSIARFLMPTLFLALVGISGSTVTALAQDFPAQVGDRIRCPFNGDIVINRDGTEFSGSVEGFGTFEVLAVEGNSAVLIPVEIEATSTFEELGEFKTRLNENIAADELTRSVVRSIGADVFPLEVPMIYPPIVTDPDGVEYTSEGDVNFLIKSSNSFNPIEDETSDLANSVKFTSEDGQSFTLVRLTATFTP